MFGFIFSFSLLFGANKKADSVILSAFCINYKCLFRLNFNE
ncbi:hypothetical protein GALL_19500 [mine drainage metagenome]|uniref:Uncharacterized protein n=1 Tax=mine drainage metagenome TaxID=410659 RepID=A0A1J5TNA0_9ZZZZ